LASVRLENVSKVYEGGVVAVRDLTFEVKEREFVVLVGPSGCGKSTTLRMIAGLEDITSGSIYIGDQLVNDVPPKDRDIAMVFQNYALYPHMTVYENMAFGLKLRKFPRTEIDKRVREAAAILEIEHYLDRKPKALSGGQRQRVAVGRTIVRKPKVFLFDEPLSNLDAKLRVQMRTEISKLHRRLAATIVYVTHDQTEAMTMGDRIVLLKEGIAQQIDAPLNLYRRPVNKFVAGFVGSPAMNFISGRLRKSKGLLFTEEGGGLEAVIRRKEERRLRPYIGKELTLGLRPEDIRIAGGGSSKGSKVRVTVEVVEPMGSEIYVHFSSRPRGKQYIARIDARKEPVVGKTLDLLLDLSKAHFFDNRTEKAL
jgi:multiple sugar transport system ATP-binding protein